MHNNSTSCADSNQRYFVIFWWVFKWARTTSKFLFCSITSITCSKSRSWYFRGLDANRENRGKMAIYSIVKQVFSMVMLFCQMDKGSLNFTNDITVDNTHFAGYYTFHMYLNQWHQSKRANHQKQLSSPIWWWQLNMYGFTVLSRLYQSDWEHSQI